jgi:hypothetical protein
VHGIQTVAVLLSCSVPRLLYSVARTESVCLFSSTDLSIGMEKDTLQEYLCNSERKSKALTYPAGSFYATG